MRLRLSLVLVLLICISARSRAVTEVIRDPNAWDYAPLQYSDVVVRGTVSAVSDSAVTSNDFWMNPQFAKPTSKTMVSVVKLNVVETLRGPKVPQQWSFIVWQEDPSDPARAYVVGKEMLICASVHPGLGFYYHAGFYGRYTRDGDSWESGPTARGDRRFTDIALRTKVEEMSIETVASEAELVFTGTVASIAKSTLQGADGTTSEQLTIRFNVEEVAKGADVRSIDVVVLSGGMYLPAWAKHVPEKVDVGQRWLCFVKKNAVGWYPFAGSNGFFRVESGHLIYDNRVPFWHNKSSVERVIGLAAEEGRK